MSEHEIAMQLTLKAMELNFIGSPANEETENTKIISDFYKAMYKTVHSVRREEAQSKS